MFTCPYCALYNYLRVFLKLLKLRIPVTRINTKYIKRGNAHMLEGITIVSIIIMLVVLAAIAGTAWFIYMKIRFRTVPSNEALIVTGPKLGDETKETNIYKDDQGRYMKVIRGGGHRLRMFQTGTKVSLKSF